MHSINSCYALVLLSSIECRVIRITLSHVIREDYGCGGLLRLIWVWENVVLHRHYPLPATSLAKQQGVFECLLPRQLEAPSDKLLAGCPRRGLIDILCLIQRELVLFVVLQRLFIELLLFFGELLGLGHLHGKFLLLLILDEHVVTPISLGPHISRLNIPLPLFLMSNSFPILIDVSNCFLWLRNFGFFFLLLLLFNQVAFGSFLLQAFDPLALAYR